MNTVWNLTELSELEEPVVSEFTTKARLHRGRHSILRGAIQVAVVATALAVIPINSHSTTQEFSVPYLDAAACDMELKSPLENLFADRFDSKWSQSDENGLLAMACARSKEFTKEELEDQALRSIYFNQHDEPSQSAANLPIEEIRQIIKRRKLV
jgi:hypothetical protein